MLCNRATSQWLLQICRISEIFEITCDSLIAFSITILPPHSKEPLLAALFFSFLALACSCGAAREPKRELTEMV